MNVHVRSVTVGSNSVQTVGRAAARGAGIRWLLLAVIIFGIIAVSPQLAQAQEETETGEPSQERLYFEDTGQFLEGPFLSSWLLHGGQEVTGSPVSAATKLGDKWVQWFEYARLEIEGVELEDAVAEDVTRAPVGTLYATRFGYVSNHPAFKPLPEAPEGTLFFQETGHSVANGFREQLERPGYNHLLGSAISEEFSINGTTYQFFSHGALAFRDNDINRVPVGTLDAMLNGALSPHQGPQDGAQPYSADYLLSSSALAGERWIEVDLSDYRLTAYIGEVPVLQTSVVTGDPRTPTVTGEFHIWWKLRSQTMEGIGPTGDEYLQEDVPNVMYFFQDWAIHGAYWRNSFGHSGSAGCVNVPVETSRMLYQFADVGTRVVVKE